jgi:hypothetical protein
MAYNNRTFRTKLCKRGILFAIPTFERRKRKKPMHSSPVRVGAFYESRWKVERASTWIDNYRRSVVHWDRSPYIYKAYCLIVLILWSDNRILK